MKKILLLLCFFSTMLIVGCDFASQDKEGKLFLQYTFNNGEEDVIEEITNLDTYQMLEAERPGYSFMAWYTDVELNHSFKYSDLVIPEKGERTVHIYADWHINNYSVKFYCSNKLTATRSVAYEGSATAPTPLFKPGYRFVGWDKEFSYVTEDIVVNAIYEEIESNDNVIVVLGNYLNDDGSISQTLRTRLELAIAAYNEFNPSYIIVSGGMANSNAGITEAQAMYNYLVARGIDSGIIIKEEQSLSTYQNAVNSVKLLETVEFKNLIVVSTIEHFTNYQTVSYFNNAISANTKVSAKGIKLMIYTNTN